MDIETRVRDYLRKKSPVAYTYDGCHKLQVLGDQDSADQYMDYGHAVHYFRADMADVDVAARVLTQMYNKSCGLRFIGYTYRDDQGRMRYADIIPQFDGECE